MKSMRLPSVAIFFMTYFHRAGGGGHGIFSVLQETHMILPSKIATQSSIWEDNQGRL